MTPVVGLRAETLTPFAYHSLAVQDGTATLPELIGDMALTFALATTLGYARNWVALPDKDYRRDLTALPWRASVLVTANPRLLPPLARRLNLEEEGGLPTKLHEVTAKGNLKQYWTTQEVPPYTWFRGALFGLDPFQATGRDSLLIRIGLHRGGMVRLTRDPGVTAVRLNAATAALFDRQLPVERFLLYQLQLTPSLTLPEAATEVAQWTCH